MVRKRNAFTLVELLIVMAVMSVLAALLLPTLEDSIRSARRLLCANNLRQWGAAIHQYANDQRNLLPSYKTPNYYPTTRLHPFLYQIMNTDGSTIFSRNLAPYGGERNHRASGSLWDCPDSPSQPINFTTGSQYKVSYGYMGYRGHAGDKTWWAGRTSDVTTNGRTTVLMADTMYTSHAITGWQIMYNHGNPQEPVNWAYTGAWASLNGNSFRPSGVNICLIDTSVKWVEWGRLNKSVYYAGSDSRSYYWTE